MQSNLDQFVKKTVWELFRPKNLPKWVKHKLFYQERELILKNWLELNKNYILETGVIINPEILRIPIVGPRSGDITVPSDLFD